MVWSLTALEVIHLGVKPHWFSAGRSFVATVPLSNAITYFIGLEDNLESQQGGRKNWP
jgi:hypothetical protein